MFGMLRRLMGNRRAATAVEYGLILALVVLSIMASLQALGGATTGMWNTISNKVETAG